MAPWTWALIAVIVVIIIIIALPITRRRRTASLQRRFGPEYDRTIHSTEDRRAAEAELDDRAKRRSQLNIVPLSEPVRLGYTGQWRDLQEQFVDRPSETVSDAEKLLARVLQERGYPVSDFDEQAELVSVDHPDLVENYRTAHAIHLRNQVGQATTEDLREALLRYRSLFEDLLRPNDDHTAPAGDPTAQAGDATRVRTTPGTTKITEDQR